MRKLIGLAGILFALTACSATTSTQTVVSSAPATGASRDTIFKNALSDPYYLDLPKDSLIPAGKLVCTQLDNGIAVNRIALNFLKNGVPAAAAGQLIGASITVYCPNHTDELDSAIESYGG